MTFLGLRLLCRPRVHVYQTRNKRRNSLVRLHFGVQYTRRTGDKETIPNIYYFFILVLYYFYKRLQCD